MAGNKGREYLKVLGVVIVIALSMLLFFGLLQFMQPQIAPASLSPSLTSPPSPSPSPSPTPRGTPAPLFTLTDIDGNEFSLEDFRGRVVVLVFFYTQCPHCISELQYLSEARERYSIDEVEIVSIDVAPQIDTLPVLQQFREAYHISWRIARDTAGVAQDYEIKYTPTTLLIDKSGYVYKFHIGTFWLSENPSELLDEIDALLSH